MTKIISIIGTRPEAIRVMKDLPDHLVVNTGQHYDENMDAIFWKERGFKPDMNLGSKSFSEIYERVSDFLEREKPKLVISYGDSRSSLIATLSAKNCGIKVAHLEAGVRCYDMNMPEERYRIMIDAISDYLFVINKKGKENLLKENVQGRIFVVGDLMYDKYVQKRKHKGYVLMTIHRKQNQDAEFIKKLIYQYEDRKIIFPIHPVMIKFFGANLPERWEIIEPVKHEKMLELIRNAELVVTDSGGVQREAFFMGVPVKVMLKKQPFEDELNVFGNGRAEVKIKDKILEICKEI